MRLLSICSHLAVVMTASALSGCQPWSTQEEREARDRRADGPMVRVPQPIFPTPDLVPLASTVETDRDCQNFFVTINAENRSDRPAPGFSATVNVRHFWDNEVTRLPEIRDYNTQTFLFQQGLPARGMDLRSWPIRIPSDVLINATRTPASVSGYTDIEIGTLSVEVIVDPSGAVVESNNSNNTLRDSVRKYCRFLNGELPRR